MSNYTKTTDFEAKDSLPSGDSGKIIRGSEFETEFDNIATAIASKSDANNPTFTGTVTIDGLTVNGNTVLGNAATDTVTVTADIASNLIPSADDTYNLGASGAEWNDLFIDGTANIDSLVAGSGSFTSISTTGDMTFGDNDKAIFGAGSDLEIYHDGSNSYIKDAGDGTLRIQGSSSILMQKLDGEIMMIAREDGAVELNHNGLQKIKTTSTGIDVTGVITTDGMTTSADINFGDNDKAVFGTGSDLQIYHDGSDSYIRDSGQGDLRLRGTQLKLEAASGERFLEGVENGLVRIYYDNQEKLATTSTGIDVTGTATMDGLTVDGDISVSDISPSISLMESDTTDLNTFLASTAGDFTIFTRTDAGVNSKQRLNIDHATGDISFYEDTGTTAKFFWDSSAESLGIGTTSPTTALDVTGTVNADALQFGDSFRYVKYSASDDNTLAIGSPKNIEIHLDNNGGGGDFRVLTGSNGYNAGVNRFNIDATSGNVGIGTDSPSQKLHLSNNGVVAIRATNATNGVQLDMGASTSSVYVGAGTSHPLVFQTGFTERARIDTSGNLLVGKTSPSSATVGFQVGQDGFIAATRTSSEPLVLNRLTSDGAIASFRKDGTTVGSIGTRNGTPYFANNVGEGIRIIDGYVSPCDSSGNGSANTVDLGSPAYEFKDLYLSGGAYIGGTAAANKLDDYEEGTWTPVLTTDNSDMTVSSYTNQDGLYTKVGDLVTIAISLQIGGFTSVGTGSLSITGLPFTPSTAGNFIFYGSSTFSTNAGWVNTPDSMGVFGDANKFRLVKNNTTMTATDLGGGAIWVRGALTYKTA